MGGSRATRSMVISPAGDLTGESHRSKTNISSVRNPLSHRSEHSMHSNKSNKSNPAPWSGLHDHDLEEPDVMPERRRSPSAQTQTSHTSGDASLTEIYTGEPTENDRGLDSYDDLLLTASP